MDRPGGHPVSNGVLTAGDVGADGVEAGLLQSILEGWVRPGAILVTAGHPVGDATGHFVVEGVKNLEHLGGDDPGLGAKEEHGLDNGLVEHADHPGLHASLEEWTGDEGPFGAGFG